jgi:hypothetical protein
MTTELLNGHFDVAASQFLARFTELVMAPVNEPAMVWFAAPLVIATLMMALYFGRYRKEELGWNSAFANTMVFLFVSIDLIRQMYESVAPFSWLNILNSPLYLSLTVALAGFSIFSMIVVYYHLLPKNIAFKIFSDLPVNIALYAIMTVIYAGVPADLNTLVAAILLFLIAWVCLRTLQSLQRLSAKKKHEEDSILVAQEKVAEDMKREQAYPESEEDEPYGEEEEPEPPKKKRARK